MRPALSSLRRTALALALLLAPLIGFAGPAAAQGTFVFSLGPDLGQSGSDRWRGGFLVLEQRPDRPVWGALQPIYSFGLSRQGAGYIAAGLRLDLPVAGLLITPHLSVALYQDGKGGFDRRELLQFRTGVDALLPLGPQVGLGLGYHHISNAGLTRKSADHDVLRLGLLWRY